MRFRVRKSSSLEDELAEARLRNSARLKGYKPIKPRKQKGSMPHFVEDEGPLRPSLANRMPDLNKVVDLNGNEYERISNEKTGLSRFGITREQWLEMVEEQESRCAICGALADYAPSLAIDHCHKTGKVRALLCRKCNTALGLLNDDPDLLRKAAQYIEDHGEKR